MIRYLILCAWRSHYTETTPLCDCPKPEPGGPCIWLGHNLTRCVRCRREWVR